MSIETELTQLNKPSTIEDELKSLKPFGGFNKPVSGLIPEDIPNLHTIDEEALSHYGKRIKELEDKPFSSFTTGEYNELNQLKKKTQFRQNRIKTLDEIQAGTKSIADIQGQPKFEYDEDINHLNKIKQPPTLTEPPIQTAPSPEIKMTQSQWNTGQGQLGLSSDSPYTPPQPKAPAIIEQMPEFIKSLGKGSLQDLELIFSPLTSIVEAGRQTIMGGTGEQVMHAAQRELARPRSYLGLPADIEKMKETEYIETLPSSKKVPEILKGHGWANWVADIIGNSAEMLPYFATPTGVYGAIVKGGETAIGIGNLYRKVLTTAIEKGDTYTVRKITQILQNVRKFGSEEIKRLINEEAGFIGYPNSRQSYQVKISNLDNGSLIGLQKTLQAEYSNLSQVYKQSAVEEQVGWKLKQLEKEIIKREISGESPKPVEEPLKKIITQEGKGVAEKIIPSEMQKGLFKEEQGVLFEKPSAQIPEGLQKPIKGKEPIGQLLYRYREITNQYQRPKGENINWSSPKEVKRYENWVKENLALEDEIKMRLGKTKGTEIIDKIYNKQPITEYKLIPTLTEIQKEINIQEGFIMSRTNKDLLTIRKSNTSTPESYLKALKRETERVKIPDKDTKLFIKETQAEYGLNPNLKGHMPRFEMVELDDIIIDPKLLQPRDVDPVKGVDMERVQKIAENFNLSVLNPIKVIPHPTLKGKWLLYDGHHTKEATILAGYKGKFPIEWRPISVEEAQELAITAGVSQKPLHALEAGKKFRIKSDLGMGLEEIKKSYGVEYSIGEIQRNIDLTYLSPSLQDMVKTKAISISHAGVIGKAAKQNPSIFTPMVQQEIALEFLGKEKGITPNILDNLIERLKPAIAQQMNFGGFGQPEVKGFIRALSELRASITELTTHQKRLGGFLKVIKEAKKAGTELPTAYVQAAELAEQDIIKLRGKVAEIEKNGLKKLAPSGKMEGIEQKGIEKIVSQGKIENIDRETKTLELVETLSKEPRITLQRALEDAGLSLPFETKGGISMNQALKKVIDEAPTAKFESLWNGQTTIGRQKFYQRTELPEWIKPSTSYQKLLGRSEPLPKPQTIQQVKSEYKKLIANKDYGQAQQMISEWTGTTKFGKKKFTGYPPSLDLKDIEVVRPKQFLPYGSIEDLSQIEELAFHPKGRILPTRYWQTMWRTFDELGTKAKEIFQRPMLDAEHQVVIRTKAFLDDLKGMQDKLKVNNQASSKRIGRYAVWQEPEGRAIMEASGPRYSDITKEPVLSPAETQMYEWGRKQYDSWFHRLNYYRKYMGKTPIKYRQDYFTHMKELSVLEEMGWSPVFADVDTAIAKGIHRNSPSFRFEKARTGGLRQLDFDYYSVLQNYTKSAIEHTQLGPVTYKLREMISKPITDISTGKKWLFSEEKPRAFKELNKWLDFVAKQKNPIDSELDSVINRTIGALNKNVAFSVLSGNIQSALIQPSVFVNTVSIIGPKYTAIGITRYLNEGIDFAIKNSKVLEGRYFDVSFYELAGSKGLKDRIGKAGLYPLRWLDMQTALASWYGSYEKGLAEGLKGLDVIRYADDMVIKSQASAARSLLSPIQRSQLGKTATLFQTFVISNWDFLGTQIFNPKLGKVEMVKRMTTYLVGSAMANALYEDVLGLYSPFPSPTRAAMKVLNKDDSDIWDLVKTEFSELAQPVPVIGGTVRFGSGIGGAVTDTIGKLFTGKASVTETGLKLAGMPGVQQIKKSIRGLLEGNDIRDLYAGPNKYRVNLLMSLYETLENLTEEETAKSASIEEELNNLNNPSTIEEELERLK